MELFSRFIAENRDGAADGWAGDTPSCDTYECINSRRGGEKSFRIDFITGNSESDSTRLLRAKSAEPVEAYHGKFIGHDYGFEAQNCLIARKFINLSLGKGKCATWLKRFGVGRRVVAVLGVKRWWACEIFEIVGGFSVGWSRNVTL